LSGLWKGLASVAGLAWGPAAVLAGREGAERDERLGRVPALSGYGSSSRHGPRVWIHASSVGEAGVAHAVARALWDMAPATEVFVSATTSTGLARAREIFGDRAAGTAFAPLDAPFAVARALSRVRPKVLAMVETEIWPNWLAEARRRGIPTVLVNGRLSGRSISRYLAVRPLFARALSGMSAFSMISTGDAARIARLGAPTGRIFVGGNAKYDDLARPRPGDREGARDLLGLSPGTPAWVAGSTRTGEEEAVLAVHRRLLEALPGAVLILAPRHLRRTDRVQALAGRAGLGVQRLSKIRAQGRDPGRPVILVDTMGELFTLYGAADAAFVGASLAPKGGQNPLEPACWGLPVLFGPHMNDFAEAKAVLTRHGGGETVAQAGELYARVRHFLENPREARETGRRARRAVDSLAGAAEAHARVIANLLY